MVTTAVPTEAELDAAKRQADAEVAATALLGLATAEQAAQWESTKAHIGYYNDVSNGLRCVSFLLSLQLLLRTRTSRALQVDVACFLSPPEFSERHLLPCRCPELVLVNWK